MPGATGLTLQQVQATLSVASERLHAMSLKHKIEWLRQHRVADPVQQMQSDAIVELYEAVRQIQEAIWPMLALIPDVSAAREAASQGGGAPTPAPAVSKASVSKLIRRT
jgi:hypothetical protein